MRRFITAVLAAFIVLVPIARAAEPEASEITVPHFKYPFQNWDYDTNAHRRDNPVTLLFVSDDYDMVSHVYSQLGSVGIGKGGSHMQLRGIGGSRPGVNPTDPWTSSSAGRKGAFGCWGACGKKTDIHVRTYGPDGHDGTQIYQASFGYRPFYLVATIHFDRDEHGANKGFGWQAKARRLLVTHMEQQGLWTAIDKVPVQNRCDSDVGTQHCHTDGKAWVIDIGT